jgi:hypothetical protein
MERRYIARVVGVKPEIVETRTDYLVAIPRFRKAFMVAMNPMAEAAVGRDTALAAVRKARAKDLTAFADGRCTVYVFCDAWESQALVERAADVVAESQLGGLAPHPEMYPAFGRALRAALAWLSGLLVAKSESDVPDAESLEVRPASAPVPIDSGAAAEETAAEVESKGRAPAYPLPGCRPRPVLSSHPRYGCAPPGSRPPHRSFGPPHMHTQARGRGGPAIPAGRRNPARHSSAQGRSE